MTIQRTIVSTFLEKLIPKPDVSLQYCSLQEHDLRALIELCWTTRFVQYWQSIFALKTASSVVLHVPNVSKFFAVHVQHMR